MAEEELPSSVLVGVHQWKIVWNRTPLLEEIQRTRDDRYGDSTGYESAPLDSTPEPRDISVDVWRGAG